MGQYCETYSRPVTMDVVEENGKIWMALLNRNGICEIDIETRRARICKVFDNEPIYKNWLYFGVEKAGCYLIFSPCDTENIAIYNLECDVITYIPLKKLDQNYKMRQDEAKFWNVFRHGSDIYLLGYSYPAIVKLNVESMEAIYITDWLEEVEDNIRSGLKCGYFGDGYVISGDLVLLAMGCMRAVLELNMKTAHTKLIKLGISMEGIGGLSSADGENIWLVGKGTRTNRVSCWNRRTGYIKEYVLSDINEDVFEPFYAPICTDSKIFLMPIAVSGIYKIDVYAEKIERCEMPENLFKNIGLFLWPGGKTMAPRLRGDWIVFLENANLEWCEYNVTTGEFRSYDIYWEEDEKETEQYYKALYLKLREDGKMFQENMMPMEFFLNCILKIENQDVHQQETDYLNGGIIYAQICG